MNTNRTPFLAANATPDVAINVQPCNDTAKHPLGLKKANQVIEWFAHKNMGYMASSDYTASLSHAQGYAKTATEEELVAQWARCAVRACVDVKSNNLLTDVNKILCGFPTQSLMSQSWAKLEYGKKTIFEGSAWDLIIDMLLVPQRGNDGSRLARCMENWIKSTTTNAINECPNTSPVQKMEYLWEAVAKRAHIFMQTYDSTNVYEKLSETDERFTSTSLCNIIPLFFSDENLAFKMVADPLWQKWLKYANDLNPHDVANVVASIIGASMDAKKKTQLTQHLTSILGQKSMQKVLNALPTQKIVQGLWKSYLAATEGCGVSPEIAIKMHANAFAQSLPINVESTLQMDRYLPIFKTIETINTKLPDLAFFLWRRSKGVKAGPMDKAWEVLQKHDVVPNSLHWGVVCEELKEFHPVTNSQTASDTLNNLIQNHRLRAEIENTIAKDAPTPSRRRM